MTVKEIAFKHENLAMKAWALASTVAALNEALYRGDYDASTYEGAFYQLVQTSYEVSRGANELIEDLFAASKEGGREQ